MWALMAAGQKEERARVLFQSEVEDMITDVSQELFQLRSFGSTSLSPQHLNPTESLPFQLQQLLSAPLRLTVSNSHADGLFGQSLSAGNDMQSTGFLN